MAKIEWEKCPITQFLDVIPKLFQIRRVCAKIIDNNPYPFWCQKLLISIHITNTNFVFKNIFDNMVF